MSIIPCSRLTSCDLALLGNNLDPSQRRRNPQPRHVYHRRQLAAVNRSLINTGEKVGVLYTTCLDQPARIGCAVAS
jgi:hypothetical protein